MQIYTQQTINQLRWPGNDPGSPILDALVREGPRPFIANVRADVHALAVGGFAIPLVQIDQAPKIPNAYVCSPTTHYIDYAQREVELELAKQPVLRRTLPPLLGALRPLLRWSQIERSVYVNNWLLSTNLYPALSAQALQEITTGLLTAYPDHSIVFRSLNPGLNGPIIAQLETLGYQRVFSRQVYLLDPRDGAFRRRNNYGNDRRWAKRSPYRWLSATQIPTSAAERLCELYSYLYLEKYSHYNPQFTPHYLERALAGSWMEISALEHSGQIDGVLGFIEQHGLMTAPLVGYDAVRGDQAGIYRLLMLALLEQAAERGRVLHLSSGASSFKMLRGAEPQVEYSLVYHRHLPRRRQLPWQLLAQLSHQVIIPLMQRYGL